MKNKVFNHFSICLGSKNIWPEIGSRVHQGPKKKKNRSVFNENTFFETATKNKFQGLFFDFLGSEFFFFVSLSLTEKTGPQPLDYYYSLHSCSSRGQSFGSCFIPTKRPKPWQG